MGPREEFLKRIERKEQEIWDLEMQLREARVYLQALQDSLKLFPREPNGEEVVLRPGSTVARARDVIKEAGNALHLTQILEIMGKPTDKKHRLSLGGSLSAYARRGEVFTRPAPNTFGLVAFGNVSATQEVRNDPPEFFGRMQN